MISSQTLAILFIASAGSGAGFGESFGLLRMASGQLSKANEPCQTDADCITDWEICVKQDRNIPKVQVIEVESTIEEHEVQEETNKSVCVHKD